MNVTNIIQDGGNILFRQINSDIQYLQSSSSTWNTVSVFPIQITNNNPLSTNVLIVKITTDIIVNNFYFYFICGSEYITIDGQDYTFNINNVSNFLGLIQNGVSLSNGNGKSNIIVKNIKIDKSGTTSLIDGGGYICQSYFGKGSSNISIIFCSNKGRLTNISNGGICGSYAGLNGALYMSNCSNSGTIYNSNSGGICGSYCGAGGSVTINRCFNTADMYESNSGGICGSYAGSYSSSGGSVTIINCYSTGHMYYINSGGICGSHCGAGGLVTIDRCFTTGDISRSGCGGICGSYTGTYASGRRGLVTITDCYSRGTINGEGAGGICGTQTANQGDVMISNSYTNGIITGANAGGIVGSYSSLFSGLVTITNCYSNGSVDGVGSGGIFGNNGSGTYQNCYVSNRNWSDITANTILTGTPSSPGIDNVGTTWYSRATNIPYLLTNIEFSTISNVVYNSDSSIIIYGNNLLLVTSILVNDNITSNSFVINSDTSISAIIPSNTGVITSVKITNTNNLYDIFNTTIFPICFPAGTPVLTDQGVINIEKIDNKINTIQNKKIVAITQTLTNEKYLICIEKDALGNDIPSQQTIISSYHRVIYRDQFIPAKYLNKFIKNKNKIYNIEYNNEFLYNILMENHEKIIINNMIVETLHPKNIIAKIYSGNFNKKEKKNIIIEINDCIKDNNLKKFKEICNKLN